MIISLYNTTEIEQKNDDDLLEILFNSATTISGLCCPDCQSRTYKRNGKTNTKQRYKCKQCSRTFYSTCNTPFHRLQKSKQTLRYLNCLKNGYSLRKAAQETGISLQTSFSWRHKFLTSLHNPVDQKMMSRVKYVEQIKLPYSQKGIKSKSVCNTKYPDTSTLLIHDVFGNTQLTMLVQNKSNASTILGAHTTPSDTLLYKPDKLLNSLQRKTDRKFQKKSDPSQPILEKINQWLSKFRGVASKYLQQYWAWYMCETYTSSFTNDAIQFILRCCSGRDVQFYFQTLH